MFELEERAQVKSLGRERAPCVLENERKQMGLSVEEPGEKGTTCVWKGVKGSAQKQLLNHFYLKSLESFHRIYSAEWHGSISQFLRISVDGVWKTDMRGPGVKSRRYVKMLFDALTGGVWCQFWRPRQDQFGGWIKSVVWECQIWESYKLSIYNYVNIQYLYSI